eukprot:5500351-Alexandrium_andersonii.AAC.1
MLTPLPDRRRLSTVRHLERGGADRSGTRASRGPLLSLSHSGRAGFGWCRVWGWCIHLPSRAR